MSVRKIIDNQVVFDPRGEVRAEHRDPAARPSSLEGLRVAVLDNSKWNAGDLLRTLVERLRDDLALERVGYFTKESFSKAASPDLLDEIASRHDVVLTAIGD